MPVAVAELLTQIVLHGALLAVKGGSAIGLSATDARVLLACFLMIHEVARHGYVLSPGTLYSMLHGLERSGYLRSKIKRSGRTFRRLYRVRFRGVKRTCGVSGHRRAAIAHRVFDQTQKLSFVSRPILSVRRPPRGPAAEVADTGRVR